MSAQAKIIMSWDIKPETETEYFEFLVHEFIPGMTRLGIGDIEVWLTIYGEEHEQKLASGIARSQEQMRQILNTGEWGRLTEKLTNFVENFVQKVVPAHGGWQV